MSKPWQPPSPVKHSIEHTRRLGKRNPLWAKMLAGLMHGGDRLAYLSDGERAAALAKRAKREAMEKARTERLRERGHPLERRSGKRRARSRYAAPQPETP